MKYCFSTLIIFLLLRKCKSLYDYVCEDPQLHKTHVRAFVNNRNGEEIDLHPIGESGSAGENFYIINTNNTYICINGPAYLYYSKTTTLGEVYESPEMKVYDHICDTYNVYPDKGATKRKIAKKLHAILLMGDKNNYYKYPALQLFTAPYYDKFRNHYINATSLIIFGDQPCFIVKGGQSIRIQPPPGTALIPSEKGRYCTLGYSFLLKVEPADPPTVPADDMTNARDILNNVEDSIRNGGCSYSGYEHSAKSFQTVLKNLQEKISGYRKRPLIDWGKRIEELDKKISALTDPGKTAQKKKLEDQKKKFETLKDIEGEIIKIIGDKTNNLLGDAAIEDNTLDPIKVSIEKVIEDAVIADNKRKEIIQLEARRVDLKLKLKREPYMWDDVKTKITDLTSQIKIAKDALDAVAGKITTDWTDIGKAIISAKQVLARLEVYYAERNKKKPRDVKDDELIKLVDKEAEKIIPTTEITMAVLGTAAECIDIRKPYEFCEAAKPNKEDVCTLFKSSLGYATDPFTEVDSWKKEVLGLVEDIFNTACFRLNKKFTRNVHRIFKYYLTDSKYFNKQIPSPSKPPDPNNVAPPTASTASTDTNKIERPFWCHIKKALEECKKNRQLLFISPNTTANSGWTLKRNNAGPSIDIIHHQEQAELEYSFNYVIDWQFKIFATVLGLCMPAYEAKVPLITSRFYAMYTEDFIIPLRETWVNSKDNKVFTWILGEHKHHDDDKWVNNCMEASFLQSNKVEYRPPRCVLVNEKSEHNYYISGTFPYGHKGIYANG